MGRTRKNGTEARKQDGRVKETQYAFTIYPDSTSYNCQDVITYLKDKAKYYCFAIHDRDFLNKEEGLLKKTHIHVFVQFANPRYADNLAETLGLNLNDIEYVKSKIAVLKYYTHKTKEAKTDGKTEYEWSSFDTNILEEDVFTQNQNKELTEIEKIKKIREYIKHFDGLINVSDVSDYCVENGLWSEWRRNQAILRAEIKERNHDFAQYDCNKYEYEQFLRYKKLFEEANGAPVGFYRADNVPF